MASRPLDPIRPLADPTRHTTQPPGPARRRSTSLALATTLAALHVWSAAPAKAQGQEGQGRALKVLPLADITFRDPAPRAPRLGALTGRNRGDEVFQRFLVEREFVCSEPTALVDLVRELATDIEGASMMLRGQSLLVAGKPEKVAEIEQIVQAMGRAMTQRFTVMARIYRIDPTATFPGSASAERLGQLTQGLPLVWDARTTTLSGQQVVLAQERFTHYVADVGVEVAEECAVARPITGTMFEGIRMIVESHTLIGSTDRVFKCQFALGERVRDIELLATGVRQMPQIGIPHLCAASGTFSGRVAHDGALLVALQGAPGAGSNMLLVLQAGPTESPSPEVSAGRTLLLPISALASGSLQQPMPFRSPELDAEGNRGGYPDLEIQDEQNDRAETLISLLRESLGSLLEEEGAGLDITGNSGGHGFILVRGSEKMRGEARRLLAALQDEWLQSIEVQTRTELQPVRSGRSPFTPLDDGQDAPRTLLHSLTFPALVGDTVILMKGVESALVSDYETAIANKATLSNPIVHTTFRGVITGVRPMLLGKSTGVDLFALLQHLAPATRQATVQETVGDLFHADVRRSVFRHSGPVRTDQAIALGWGPAVEGDDSARRMVQSVRFRKL